MKRTVVALGLVGVLALTASAVFAWGPGWGRGLGPGYGPGPAVANLSPDQTAKIQKIQSDRYAEMANVRSEMFAKRAELQALFREQTLDQDKIAAKQKEIVALQAQMQEKALAARTAVAEVLTPEQRAQLPALGPGMGPGFGPGFGPGRGIGPGMGMGPMGMGPRVGFGPRW
ncbi:MAG: Spy/CpxP family protein refolding chaperone [candidate division NC10 bacterium]|nr:Spy/CpxP family protein refolding chaperone [candidate division NC10 bacterium]